MNDRIEMISLDAIEPHPANRRIGGFDEKKLAELAESIRAVGVQQPAIVRRLEGRIGVEYQLVAGERRWRASRLAGFENLPCIVRDLDDATALKIQYIENLQRDDVHPLDEADGYARLIAEAGYTIEQLASEIGKSISYVYQRMKLESLVPEVRKLFTDGAITAGHAILIARLTAEQQKTIAEEFAEGDGALIDWNGEIASVRELTRYIREEIMLNMSRATWGLDDANLIPEAGSCLECPKRTGYNQAMFADVCKDDQADYCTDRECFLRKRNKALEVKRAELAGEDVIEVADTWVGKEVPQSVLRNYDWTECKAKTPGAKKVLVVAGNEPGRVTWGKITKNTTATGNSKERQEELRKEKERQKREEEKRLAAEQVRVKRVDAVLEASAGTMPLEALRQCVLRYWDEVGYAQRALVAELEEWTKKGEQPNFAGTIKRINKMDEAALNRFLLRIVMCKELRFSHYQTPNTETIDALEKVFGLGRPAKAAKKGAKK